MDRLTLLQKLKDKKGLIALVVSTAVLAGAAGVVVPRVLMPKQGDSKAESHISDQLNGHASEEHASSSASPSKKKPHGKAERMHERPPERTKTVQAVAVPVPSWTHNVTNGFKEAWLETRKKMREIRSALEENEKLRIENAALQIKAESLKFDCTYKEATHKTHESGVVLTKETGSKVGRSLSSITYTPPTHLLPPQLYVLGVSYFKAKEDEKAAVILTFLTALEENDAYKTAKNYLMTGVSWYRLDNFEVADQYFAKAIGTKDMPENLPYQAQSRLWRGLVAQTLSQRSKAQFWLRDLIDHHPHSVEAGWVNPNKEAHRVPASAH